MAWRKLQTFSAVLQNVRRTCEICRSTAYPECDTDLELCDFGCARLRFGQRTDFLSEKSVEMSTIHPKRSRRRKGTAQ